MVLGSFSRQVILLLALLVGTGSIAHAQDVLSIGEEVAEDDGLPETQETGDAANEAEASQFVLPEVPDISPEGVPGEIPVKAFSGRNALGNASLSPNGKHFAMVSFADGREFLQILDAETLEARSNIEIGHDGLKWFRWANDNRLLYSVRHTVFYTWFPLPSTRLMVRDVGDENSRLVSLEKMGLEGDDVLYTDPAGRFVVLSASRELFANPDVWRVPLHGEMGKNAVLLQKRDSDVDEWFADNTGVVRLGMGWTRGGATIIQYRPDANSKFERITKLKRDAEELEGWDVLGIYEGSDLGYALAQGPEGRLALRRFDYSTGTAQDVVHAQPGWDVDAVYFDKDSKPYAVRYVDDLERTVWLDEDMARLQTQLEGALPGGQIKILSSAGRGRHLVLHSGPSDPGALYLFTAAERNLELVASVRPTLDWRLLAEGETHLIPARDGTQMRSYLTLPRGRGRENLPLVLMPHGGPYGVRDTLAYSDQVQLLVNRGYAVLQPNFRGSAGFGEAFETLGDGQIGRAMQDDLNDALDWAIAQGIADPTRICIVGASYGGYAALWGAIRDPDRYRCAASWAGVTDFEKQIDYSGDYMTRRYRRDWKRKIRGEIDLDEVSPAHQVHRLARPVLLAHGTRDTIVPFDQYERMVKAAKEAGVELETLELKDGHNLTDRENEEAWYQALIVFLEKHNPAD